MTIREEEAHALSLHLYSILNKREADGSNTPQVLEKIQGFLKVNSLEEHLKVVVRDDIKKGIGLVSRTVLGNALLTELYSRCEFFPCPAGDCEYVPASFCKWCGGLQS